jgi:hypothetical protein
LLLNKSSSNLGVSAVLNYSGTTEEVKNKDEPKKRKAGGQDKNLERVSLENLEEARLPA